MIRAAMDTDIPRIVEMGGRSLLEGPYRDRVGHNPEQAAKLAMSVISQHSGRVFVAEDDGKLVGLLAFIVFPHYFSGETTAGELIWYVEPEYRRMSSFSSSVALDLLSAAEMEAKHMGAKRMQLTAPTSEVAGLYLRRGYHQVEVSFQREL